MSLAASLALLSCAAIASLRWLRVAQYEHYLASSSARFAERWIRSSALNFSLAVGVLVAAITGAFIPGALFVAAVLVLVWPLGLGLRGRTKQLQWTRRLRTLASVEVGVIGTLFASVAALSNVNVAASFVGLAVPLTVDVSCALTRPFEERAAMRYVRRALKRLEAVAPRVVAITGSFGKTSTKEHLRDLVGATHTVVASPASFNNQAGLSRAINDHLAPGTQVFIAEMGMYVAGEIATLCSWVKPEISIITAIAPVHLERAGSIERILEAKSEILAGARCAILNVDCPELSRLADTIDTSMRVVRCGAVTDEADVVVRRKGHEVSIQTPAGTISADIDDPAVDSTNLACAVAAALELGVDLDSIARTVPRLRSPDHRCTVGRSDAGVTVIDDSFSSNIDGADRALRLLAETTATHRVVVTPGMVELGTRQREENTALGEAAGKIANAVVIVGATNRAALRSGARKTSCEAVEVKHREQAVAWVRGHAAPGDAVLYENDLPDHYP